MRRSALITIVLLSLATAASADIAPDPGYTRVSSGLVLESAADLSGFRFFLVSAMDVEEVRIAPGAPTRIEASGRGGAARYAKLIAVPLSDTGQISGDLSGPLLESMIREKRFPNAVELLSHNFQPTVPEWEKGGWSDPVYRISIDDGKLSATQVAGGRPSGAQLTYSILQFAWPAAAAGFLLACAIAVMGVWLFRRRRAKIV